MIDRSTDRIAGDIRLAFLYGALAAAIVCLFAANAAGSPVYSNFTQNGVMGDFEHDLHLWTAEPIDLEFYWVPEQRAGIITDGRFEPPVDRFFDGGNYHYVLARAAYPRCGSGQIDVLRDGLELLWTVIVFSAPWTAENERCGPPPICVVNCEPPVPPVSEPSALLLLLVALAVLLWGRR